jgi:hypothetical protein
VKSATVKSKVLFSYKSVLISFYNINNLTLLISKKVSKISASLNSVNRCVIFFSVYSFINFVAPIYNTLKSFV